MKKETFIALMRENEYKFLGKPDISNMASNNPNHDWKKHASQNEFKRGACMIFATDEVIETLTEENFPKWYEQRSSHYHFYDDWKKKFKGSEFLIPIVEKEIETRLRMQNGDFVAKLFGIKEGAYNIDEQIKKYLDKAEPNKIISK